jgi:hypothetical protein
MDVIDSDPEEIVRRFFLQRRQRVLNKTEALLDDLNGHQVSPEQLEATWRELENLVPEQDDSDS